MNPPSPAARFDAAPFAPFSSFWMGGYEGADHINGLGVALDMAGSSGHLAQLDADHAGAAALGLGSIRESIGWRLAEPVTGRFDLQRVDRIAASAARHGLQVVWTLMHYGTPADVSLFDDAMIPRFVAFAEAVARRIAGHGGPPPIYNLINEIGFVAWAVSATNLMSPYRGDPGNPEKQDAVGIVEDSRISGYEVKRRLVRAVLASIAAVRRIDPRARFLHIEPVLHVVAPADRPDLQAEARQIADYQWQAWDMIAGFAEPELGGSLEALDLIGANYYHSGQWEVQTGARLRWHEQDPRLCPLAELLGAAWSRYRRPLILAETSHIGAGRGDWLHDIASQVRRARRMGVPVGGICLYPLVDRPDWNDPMHWHHSGLWDVILDVDVDADGDAFPPLDADAASLQFDPHGDPNGDANVAPSLAATENTPPNETFGARLLHSLTDLAPDSLQEPVPAIAQRGAQPPLARRLNPEYAAALAAWQAVLPEQVTSLEIPMPHLIVFSHLRWAFVYQRPQHLMSRLAKTFPVLFVEEPVYLDPAEGPPRIDQIVKGPGVTVLVPRTSVAAPGFHDDQLSTLKPLLADHLSRHAIDDYLVWFYTPMALPLSSELRPLAVVYDCMDELSAFKDAPRQLRQRETALLKMTDLVLAGGPSLYEAKRSLHPNVHCLPSSVDSAHFAPANLDRDSDFAHEAVRLQGGIGHPRLGFFGVIDERLDIGLVDALARSHPEWQIVMVGPVVKIDPTRLPQHPNLHWLGMQSYPMLPHLMSGWDLCLMPFALNDSTRFISPTKTLEYFAGEKPVVSTPVPDVVAAHGKTVRIAPDHAGFIAACEAVLASDEAQRSALRDAMAMTVQHSSWDRSAARVKTLIEAVIATPAAGQGSSPVAAPADDAVRPVAAVNRAARHVRNLVIGAGPTGLAAAYHLGQRTADPHETLLVERAGSVGGWCRSVVEQGYTFDHAGHAMVSTDPHVVDMYTRLLGNNLHWPNHEACIFSRQAYGRYPAQGTAAGLPLAVVNEEMETSMLGGRLSLPVLTRLIESAPTSTSVEPVARFGYPLQGGYQALMDGFLPLLNCDLALDTAVLHVSPSRRTVRFDDGRSVTFDALVSTMPLPQLVQACGDEAPAEVRAAAKALRHIGVRCVNIGVRPEGGRAPVTGKHWIYCPEETVFHRIVVQGHASPQNDPAGGFGLTCEITYGPSKPLPCDGEALTARVVADCRAIGLIGPDDEIEYAGQLDMPCAYVIHDPARAANVACIRDWFASFGVVLAGRYTEWAYDDADHAFLAGRRAAVQVEKSLVSQPVGASGVAAQQTVAAAGR